MDVLNVHLQQAGHNVLSGTGSGGYEPLPTTPRSIDNVSMLVPYLHHGSSIVVKKIWVQ